MKVIMNPPYIGSLHLKILNKVISACEKSGNDYEIVNLSPVRWLQDPLAEYKKNSDWKKFKDVRNHIESLEVVPAETANKMFNISFFDLGVYHLTKEGGWNNTLNKAKSFVKKLLEKAAEKSIGDIITEEGWRGEYKGIFGVVNSHYGLGGLKCYIKDDYNLFCTPRYNHTNKVFFFNSEGERRSMFDYLTSSLIKAFIGEVKVNLRVPWRFVPVLPDYTHPWTDEDLYNYFNLTSEEIKEVEETVK